MNNFGKRDANRMATQESRLLKVEMAMRQIPSRFRKGGGSTLFYVLNDIEGGSTLITAGSQTVTGIKYDSGTSVTTVPNVNPMTPSIGSFDVGLGRAQLFGFSGSSVYCCLRPNPGTGVVTAMQSYIPNGSGCISIGKVQLPLVSDSSVLVDVYMLYRFM